MTTLAHALAQCGPSLADYPERDNPEPMEPRTEAEYLERKGDVARVSAVIEALFRIYNHMEHMSEFARDELDGRLPNVPYLDLPDDIAGAVECKRELENGIKAWEQNG